MPRTPKARIKPDLLIWARKSAGFSIEAAAKKLGVTSERLRTWEQGQDQPTIAQLRKAGNAYKRPLGVFYLPEPPLDFMPLTDFRRLPEAVEEMSVELRLEIRRAHEQRETHIELREMLELDLETARRVEMEPFSDAEAEGWRVRQLLAVDLADQLQWRESYQALNSWVSAVENLGYLVLQTSGVGLEEMRGFSIAEKVYPVIVLNGGDAPNGKIFTLLHEVVHVQLSASGVCDLHDRGGRFQDAFEVYCNQVAAATLMPQEPFLDNILVRRNTRESDWDDPAIASLARAFSVSREAILRRLLTFDRVSETFYRERRRELLEEYERRRRVPVPGFPPVATMRVRDLGRPFVSGVLAAYYDRQITAADLSRLLDARLKHLPRIEARLGVE
jgi:Zn-dependent peptidase ImmA (M78 family)/DNA-binding XRE family transcriptional regulator